MYYKTRYDSPVGPLYIVTDEESLVGLWMEDQKYFQATVKKEELYIEETKVARQTADWLDRYFANQKPEVKELPLNPLGTEFRQQVWEILCRIPYGGTTTYGEIAKEIAAKRGKKRMSAQAVGGAVGHNPIGIIIPCHRVIGKDGSLTGYAGGLDKKMWLLDHEGVAYKR